MLLSVIIPAFNEEKFLEETLTRLETALNENYSDGFTWEIIVCDNNSTDGTSDLAKRMGARVVTEPQNQISKARNRGASVARGKWLLFLDADSYPSPELMSETLMIMENIQYVGCGTTVKVKGGTVFNKLRMERLNPLYRLFNWSGGAYILCRADAFQELGGFSQDLYAYEEVDFVIRLKRYGSLRNQKFTVIHRYPVVTSGRKGEYHFSVIFILFVSNFLAIFFFGLHFLLPKRLRANVRSGRFLDYWYRGRE